MAYTQADLDALDERIASTKERIQKGDFGVTERSVDELLKIREHMKAQMRSSRPRVYGLYSTKGT